MIYIFRIRPFVRLFLMAVLIWVALTCLQTNYDGMFAIALLLFLLAGFIARGLFRMFFAYLRTWG